MPIPVTCPQCGLVLAAPESAAGKKAKCRSCQTILEIPSPGLEILDEAPVAMAMPVPKPKPVAAPAPAPVPPTPASSFSFDESPATPKKRRREEDDEEEERPRSKRRRDEDDDDERPRSRKPEKKEKGDKTLLYVIVAGFTVLMIVGLGGFGFWYAVIKKPAVETVDTSILAKPKPTYKPKDTGRTAPKDWETMVDVDFDAFVPVTGKGFGSKARDIPLDKSEEFPELGEVRVVRKPFTEEVDAYVFVFSLRQESLKQVNKDPKRAVATWSDIFLIKIPADEVKTDDFTNTQFKYSGRAYTYKHESGVRFYFRMFVAHDKYYTLLVAGDGLSDRSEYVKNFFDNFQPMK